MLPFHSSSFLMKNVFIYVSQTTRISITQNHSVIISLSAKLRDTFCTPLCHFLYFLRGMELNLFDFRTDFFFVTFSRAFIVLSFFIFTS